MLEPFETFLGEVVLQMQHSQEDKHKLQNHIKRWVFFMSVKGQVISCTPLESWSNIVEKSLKWKKFYKNKFYLHKKIACRRYKLDAVGEQHATEQLSFCCQSASKSKRLSSHFSGLLTEQEARIEKLEEKETSLQKTLDDKVTSESHLKEERRRLISVSLDIKQHCATRYHVDCVQANEELRQQLSSPSPQRSTSCPIQDQLVQQWVESESPTDNQVKPYPPVESPV